MFGEGIFPLKEYLKWIGIFIQKPGVIPEDAAKVEGGHLRGVEIGPPGKGGAATDKPGGIWLFIQCT